MLSKKIYVYTKSGEIIEFPYGSTPIDFAYKIHTDIGNNMEKAIVNGTEVNPNYILENNDRVLILTNIDSKCPNPDWEKMARTTSAKKILKTLKK